MAESIKNEKKDANKLQIEFEKIEKILNKQKKSIKSTIRRI